MNKKTDPKMELLVQTSVIENGNIKSDEAIRLLLPS